MLTFPSGLSQAAISVFSDLLDVVMGDTYLSNRQQQQPDGE